jgi:hypothetical protein
LRRFDAKLLGRPDLGEQGSPSLEIRSRIGTLQKVGLVIGVIDGKEGGLSRGILRRVHHTQNVALTVQHRPAGFIGSNVACDRQMGDAVKEVGRESHTGLVDSGYTQNDDTITGVKRRGVPHPERLGARARHVDQRQAEPGVLPRHRAVERPAAYNLDLNRRAAHGRRKPSENHVSRYKKSC